MGILGVVVFCLKRYEFMCVLFVEDDLLIGSGFEQGFKQEGFVVDWVKDGDVVLFVLCVIGYGLLLFDFGLLNCDGLLVFVVLCCCDENLFVIIIIVCDGVLDCIVGFDSGVDDYFVKLFEFDELFVCICVVSCCYVGCVQMMFVIGLLWFDFVKYFVWFDGDEVLLLLKEFVLLYELMCELGVVILCEQFEEWLYSWGEEIESNVVQVYIYNLCKKFGYDMICMVCGVGYWIGDGM